MRWCGWLLTAGSLGLCSVAVAQIAPMAPPSILKQDCSTLKGKEKARCERRNAAGDSATAKPASSADDMPTGADADVPGEPPGPHALPPQKSSRPGTSDMPTGADADPPAESMQPLKPDGTPDTEAPHPPATPPQASSSSSSSGSGTADDNDVAPTTSGSDTPVKAAALKDLGSHADTSEARVKLEQNRVQDDLKVGRFYMRDGNLQGAEARFKDALQHDPDDPEAHFAMAELLLKQKRNGEARAQLQRYLELAPDDDHTRDAQKLLAKLGK